VVNAGAVNSFSDEGFLSDFQDGHNQLFHFWAYLATAASAEWENPLGTVLELTVSETANFYHEIITQDSGSSWQDYGLAVSGMQTGLYIQLGLTPPDQLGNYLRNTLGPNGQGSYGFVPFLINLIPLAGNR